MIWLVLSQICFNWCIIMNEIHFKCQSNLAGPRWRCSPFRAWENVPPVPPARYSPGNNSCTRCCRKLSLKLITLLYSKGCIIWKLALNKTKSILSSTVRQTDISSIYNIKVSTWLIKLRNIQQKIICCFRDILKPSALLLRHLVEAQNRFSQLWVLFVNSWN